MYRRHFLTFYYLSSRAQTVSPINRFKTGFEKIKVNRLCKGYAGTFSSFRSTHFYRVLAVLQPVVYVHMHTCTLHSTIRDNLNQFHAIFKGEVR